MGSDQAKQCGFYVMRYMKDIIENCGSVGSIPLSSSVKLMKFVQNGLNLCMILRIDKVIDDVRSLKLEVMQQQLRAQEEAQNRNVEAPIRNLFQPVIDQGVANGLPIQANTFELKTSLILMLQHPFKGTTMEDPNEHIQKFLEYSGTMKVNGVPEDTIRLRLFPSPRVVPNLGPIGDEVLTQVFPTRKNSQAQGYGTDHQVCIFYGGNKNKVRTLMDMAVGGSLLARGPEEALRIIEEMASNSFQWPVAREGVQILKKVASTSSSDALGLLVAQMATLNSKIEAFTNSRAESSQNQFEEVNYVNQGGGFSNQQRLFNSGNPNNAIQPPPDFLFTNGVIDEEKKPKMDKLLMAFIGKTKNYMKDSQVRIGKLENTVGAIVNQVNTLEKQMG
ncbi:hypothetical protein C2S52_012527 [Perilla frutescens var. hirtella]|nr:hypothetical protein C2S52_012527 [Perilla frutescens var. hirtella]